jgi:alpha-beta hydrolase superfamily lysophospholipase
MFKMLMKVGPKWKIVPTKNVLPLCFKDRAFLDKAMADPLSYKGKPRVRMAWECLEATRRVSEGLARVDLPFIVLHGEADRVTAPQASRDLHERASSTDKTLKIYDGMWHALMCEPDGGAERCLKDVHDWIHARAGPSSVAAPAPAPAAAAGLTHSGSSRTSLI